MTTRTTNLFLNFILWAKVVCVQFAKLGKGVILYRSRHYIHDPLGLSSFKYILSTKVAILKFHRKVSLMLLCEKEIPETHFTVGTRDFGLECKHANAIVATRAISCTSRLSVGGKRRGSKTSFSITSWLDEDGDNDERSSPGCIPIIFSSATTPKSYRHHIFLSRP